MATKNLKDYIIPDNAIFRNTNLDEIFEELQSDLLYFEDSNNFKLHRHNSLGVNNYGYKLTDFCMDNNLYIVNGRGGHESCKTTCKNISTIDYFLSSPNNFPLLQCLYVHDFCELLSDSHNAVSLTFKIESIKSCSVTKESISEKPKMWDPEKADAFINNFNTDKVKHMCNILGDLSENPNFCQSDLNTIVDSLNHMYVENSQISFGTFVTTRIQNSQSKTPRWFNKKCKTARFKFHNAKHQYKLRKTDENKHKLQLSSKAYKKNSTRSKYII